MKFKIGYEIKLKEDEPYLEVKKELNKMNHFIITDIQRNNNDEITSVTIKDSNNEKWELRVDEIEYYCPIGKQLLFDFMYDN